MRSFYNGCEAARIQEGKAAIYQGGIRMGEDTPGIAMGEDITGMITEEVDPGCVGADHSE